MIRLDINKSLILFTSSLIIFTLFKLTNADLKAQNSHGHSFQWQPVKSISSGDSVNYKIFAFKNAAYNFSKTAIPYYMETIPLPSNEFNFDLKIKEFDYTPFPIDSAKNIKGIKNIPDSIRISTTKKITRKEAIGQFKIYPIVKSDSSNKLHLITNIKYQIRYKPDQQVRDQSIHNYANNSVLANGKWYKVRVNRTGIYKLTYTDLKEAGVPVSSVNPSKLQLYGNGGEQLPYNNSKHNPDDLNENSIYLKGANDGSFDNGDFILFYAQGPSFWKYKSSLNRFVHDIHEYDEEAYYFLTYGQQSGKRIQQKSPPSSPATHTTTTFDSYRFHEKESVNLLHSGRRWFGNVYDIKNQHSYKFNFPELVSNKPVKFRVALAARHTSNTQFKLNINGQNKFVQIPAIANDYLSTYAGTSKNTFSLNLNNGNINMNVTYQKPVSSTTGWMDYIEINAREKLKYRNQQLAFRDMSVTGNGNVAEYTISNASQNVKVWDVTQPYKPKLINTDLTNNQLVFKATADTLRNFIAHKNSYYNAKITSKVDNQNLHGLSQTDMVIVTPPAFEKQAKEVADIHRSQDNLTVHIVKPYEVYNEFSSGQKDVTAIRNFMRMFYDRATSDTELPDYLLLFGDGTYDPKNRIGGNKNTIITFQSSTSLNPTRSYITDDYFGLFDPGEGVNAYGSLDLGIGRLPVSTVEEANNAVTKIKRYLNMDTTAMKQDISQNPSMVKTLQDWRNIICFIADDEDDNLHLNQADGISNKLQNNRPTYNIDKIYFDAYKQVTTPGGQRYPEANEAINERMQKGTLIMNYTGHGGEAGWAHEQVLKIDDITSWENKYNMPIFMTATCEFSRFDNPKRVSAGEHVFLNPNGGAIALFSTTRVAYAGSNAQLNQSFYNNLFKKSNGETLRLGDLMRYSKVEANSSQNHSLLNFALLGDPALQPAFPEKQVTTTSINHKDTSITDTLSALSEVTVEGKIMNESGSFDSTFNGILYPTVYDKASKYETRGQDPESNKTSFRLRDNILYKGKASINNGKFSFKFVIPKDISYDFGKGKISYYADNGITDANGYYNNFLIGETSDSADTDQTGPEIELFMNDFSFESGDITNENPVLLARLYDEHGINTVGNGIGHDIVVILDKNPDNQAVLNDYYESDLDSYQEGTVRYPYSNLSEGRHTLTVKAWDVYNNSSEATIEFVVTNSENVSIKNLTVYPNPSQGNVWFTFDHNQACCGMEFMVEIFNLKGQKIETLNTNVNSEGYSVSPLKWDGKSASGSRVEGGMFIYIATLKTDSGISKQKKGKIVILK